MFDLRVRNNPLMKSGFGAQAPLTNANATAAPDLRSAPGLVAIRLLAVVSFLPVAGLAPIA
jgi:hypothetical protein